MKKRLSSAYFYNYLSSQVKETIKSSLLHDLQFNKFYPFYPEQFKNLKSFVSVHEMHIFLVFTTLILLFCTHRSPDY